MNIEPLETRIAPATLVALNTADTLLVFDSADPTSIIRAVPVNGLGATEDLHGIDFRPADGLLYGLGITDGAGANDSEGRIYTIDLTTGDATQVGAVAFSTTLADGASYGFDFNPVADRIRVTNSADQNFRVDPATGALANGDPSIAFAALDVNAGDDPVIAGSAYSNSFFGATSTVLFSIETGNDVLVSHSGSPGFATINTLGSLGVVTSSDDVAFYISPGAATGLATLEVAGATGLYSVNTTTGEATSIGLIDDGTSDIRGLAALPGGLTFVNATTATYQDADGDDVTVKVSGGALLPGDLVLQPLSAQGGAQLRSLNLTDLVFSGASVSIVATRHPVLGGDGLVNVGHIDAAGRDLGTVLVDGDLGVIDAGDPTNPASATKALTVLSLGRHGASTGAPADLRSDFDGRLDKLTVKTDVQGATINVTDSAGTNGAIGSIFLGGALLGGAADDSGRIVTSADIGAVTIKGDIAGGDGMNSGVLKSGGKIASVTLGGSLRGGTNVNAGQIISTLDMGPLKITGNVRGGTATGAGLINSLQNMTSVFVGDSLVGGSASNTGEIVSLMTMSKVFIDGDVIGGAGADSGKIKSEGNMGTLTINGSVIGGAGDQTGSGHNGQIVSLGDMGAVKIGHDVRGAAGAHSAEIRAVGKLAGVTVLGSLLGGPAGVVGEFAGRIESGGDLGAVKIGHDVAGGNGEGSGAIRAGSSGVPSKIASVTIGGSLLGGTNLDSGQIRSGGDMGAVKIVGDIKGSSGQSSGLIRSAKLASLTVGGSLIGGSGVSSGKILPFDDTGAVKIGHDVIGGSAQESGLIFGQANVLSVTIGGSVIGGGATSTGVVHAAADLGPVKIGRDVVGSAGGGAIFSSFGKVGAVTIGGSVLGGSLSSRGDMGPVKIAGDLAGASITGAATSTGSGSIFVGSNSFPETARLVSLFVGGSIIAGVDDSSEDLEHNASIRVRDDIGSITVKGSIVGSADTDGDPSDGDFTPVVITARGQTVQGATTDLAIGKISVGGRVERAMILGGYTSGLSGMNAANPDAQIGAVSVGGNWIASSLVAGAQNNGLPENTHFGNSQDLKISAGTDNGAITSKIASITIGGQVMGTIGGTDHFGFVAEQVGAFKVGGTTIPLIPDPAVDDNVPLGTTGDVNIHEV